MNDNTKNFNDWWEETGQHLPLNPLDTAREAWDAASAVRSSPTPTPPAPSAGSGPENPAVEHIRDALAYVRPLVFVISEDGGEPPWRRAKADRSIAKLDAAMLAMDGLSNTERSGGGQ